MQIAEVLKEGKTEVKNSIPDCLEDFAETVVNYSFQIAIIAKFK